MANYGDYFSEAFNKSYVQKAQNEFEKWKVKQEQPFKDMQRSNVVLEGIKTKTEMGIPLDQTETAFVASLRGGQSGMTQPQTLPQPPIQGGGMLPNMGLIQPQIGNPPMGASNIPYVAGDLNAFGQPKSYVPDPIATKQAEESAKIKGKEQRDTAKEAVSNIGFFKQFGRSYSELNKYDPNIGKVGIEGWARRKKGSIANYLDELPETKAFQAELLPKANAMARNIEGGRITDQDREIYANSFANALKHSTQTNVRLASNSLLELKRKGGDITPVLKEMYEADVPVIKDIVNNVLKDSPELKNSIFGVPEGWEIVNE